MEIDRKHDDARSSTPTSTRGARGASTARRGSRAARTLGIATVAVATLVATQFGTVTEARTADRPTGCVARLTVDHVPGRLARVWVIRCVPVRLAIW